MDQQQPVRERELGALDGEVAHAHLPAHDEPEAVEEGERRPEVVERKPDGRVVALLQAQHIDGRARGERADDEERRGDQGPPRAVKWRREEDREADLQLRPGLQHQQQRAL